MNKDGINNTLQFILKETTPIYELGQKSTIEESDKKLLKGTIVDGQLKTRIVNIDGERIPFKFIQLKDKNDELFVYRIVQEFLNNSIKYSNSTSIQIDLKKDTAHNFIQINLMDNGIGFDFEKVARRNGLNNIERRLKSLNSEYIFKSKIGIGTELKFTVND